jgi:hypothetical protein
MNQAQRRERIMAAREVPSLSDRYYKVHKQYALFSGVLLGWELIGFELPDNPLPSINIKLASPEAIPYALVVIVAYFGFRLSIEWYQSNLRRRAMLPARLDFMAAHIFGFASIALFVFQVATQMQFIDYLTFLNKGLLFLGALPGFIGGLSIVYKIPFKKRWYPIVLVLLVVVGFASLDQSLAVGCVAGALLGATWKANVEISGPPPPEFEAQFERDRRRRTGLEAFLKKHSAADHN